MKIWFPTVKANSGSDCYVVSLAKALNSIGVETVITWLPHYYEYAPRILTQLNVPQKYDLIHTNSWTGRLTDKLSDKPIVTTCHHWVHANATNKNLFQILYHKFISKCERNSFDQSDCIVCPGVWTLNEIESLTTTPVVVIPNWVDFNRFKQLKSLKNNNTLLMVGTLSKRKGIDFLFALLDNLDKSIQIEIVCHKTKANQKHVQRLQNKYSNIHVYFDLSFDQLVNKYNNANVLLSLSSLEGFGYTYVEAMACGLPIIGFRNEALSAMVPDSFLDLLVDYGDTASLNKLINQYFKVNHNHKKVGEYLRERMLLQYNLEEYALRYKMLYESILAKKHDGT